METSLHRQLKLLYAGNDGATEVRLGQHRIDVVRRRKLFEIQHGSLAAIRRKVGELVQSHTVVVVKPIVVDKHVVHLDKPGGRVVRRRLSPKHGGAHDLFDELVYFTRVFPHPRLTLEFPLVTLEETRRPGHGKRRRWRENDFVVVDQTLLEVGETLRLRTAADLWRVLPDELPSPFDTAQLAERAGVRRNVAQRIAYCLLHCGAARQVAKRGNARLYERVAATPKRRRRAA
jgi:hypothetical protein